MSTIALNRMSMPSIGAPREVFAINFLRKRTLPPHIRRALTGAGMTWLALNAAALLALLASGRAAQQRLDGMRREMSASSDERQAFEALRTEAAAHLGRLRGIATLGLQRFSAADKLNALTNTLPARTWITGVTAQRDDKHLTIHAAYWIDAKLPYELPTTKWIAALKADPSFGHGLKRLDLGNSSRKTQGRSELFVFDLLADWQ